MKLESPTERFELLLPQNLRDFVQRVAEREMVSEAAIVRRCLAEATRRAERRGEAAA